MPQEHNYDVRLTLKGLRADQETPMTRVGLRPSHTFVTLDP